MSYTDEVKTLIVDISSLISDIEDQLDVVKALCEPWGPLIDGDVLELGRPGLLGPVLLTKNPVTSWNLHNSKGQEFPLTERYEESKQLQKELTFSHDSISQDSIYAITAGTREHTCVAYFSDVPGEVNRCACMDAVVLFSSKLADPLAGIILSWADNDPIYTSQGEDYMANNLKIFRECLKHMHDFFTDFKPYHISGLKKDCGTAPKIETNPPEESFDWEL